MPVSPVLALVGFVGLCLLVGLVSGSLVSHSMPHWYRSLHAPAGTPPNTVFAPVWFVLYIMIGVSGWLIWRELGAAPPLRLWGWQLAANALWPACFFGLRSPTTALGVIVVLLLLIALTIHSFRHYNRLAALLLLPYFAWCLYAGYLNAGFVVLNHA